MQEEAKESLEATVKQQVAHPFRAMHDTADQSLTEESSMLKATILLRGRHISVNKDEFIASSDGKQILDINSDTCPDETSAGGRSLSSIESLENESCIVSIGNNKSGNLHKPIVVPTTPLIH